MSLISSIDGLNYMPQMGLHLEIFEQMTFLNNIEGSMTRSIYRARIFERHHILGYSHTILKYIMSQWNSILVDSFNMRMALLPSTILKSSFLDSDAGSVLVVFSPTQACSSLSQIHSRSWYCETRRRGWQGNISPSWVPAWHYQSSIPISYPSPSTQ